jgi:hypothetical protein
VVWHSHLKFKGTHAISRFFEAVLHPVLSVVQGIGNKRANLLPTTQTTCFQGSR